ncbi:MAG: hypothetical protein GF317_21280 [Candidatus Lokiarchaeota archaeon]|nr:hypothetical protein [Candidatus Lokiarchaeota archaeon]MBD3201989.1 hypothetical protein [Candidatus Lokiarchaeota archaeon]
MTKKNTENLQNPLFKENKTLSKIEIISKIREFQAQAQNYKSNEDFDQAIIISDKIMRYAVQYNLPHIISEQKEFINDIAKKVEKEYFIPKIKKYTEWIQIQYKKLIKSNSVYQAHELVSSFKETFKNVSFFNSIKEVREIIEKDKRDWLKFEIQQQQK